MEYEYATYKKIFEDVKIFQVQPLKKDITQNLILVGIKGNPDLDKTKQEQYTQLLKNEVKDFTTDKQIVTDNYAPIGS